VVQPPVAIGRGPRGSAAPEFIPGVGVVPRPLTPLVHAAQISRVADNEFFLVYNTRLRAVLFKTDRRPFLDSVEEFNFNEFMNFVSAGNDYLDFRPSQYYCVTRHRDGTRVRVFVVERPRSIEGHPELNVGYIQEAGIGYVRDPEFRRSVIAAPGPFPSHHPVSQLRDFVPEPAPAVVVQLQEFDQPGGPVQSWWEWIVALFG